jgi:hypothetical protein
LKVSGAKRERLAGPDSAVDQLCAWMAARMQGQVVGVQAVAGVSSGEGGPGGGRASNLPVELVF